MKTPAQLKFDKIVKEGFHTFLKPLGFKKKANNFYLPRKDLGQIINLQKSTFYSKDYISFTINTGLFLPECWLGFFYNKGKEIPVFPTEYQCLVRKRIGELKDGGDIWYNIAESTDENIVIQEMQINLEKYILPYFDIISTKDAVLKILDKETRSVTKLDKLITYGELEMFDKANKEYKEIIESQSHPNFLETVKEYGKKYGLV